MMHERLRRPRLGFLWLLGLAVHIVGAAIAAHPERARSGKGPNASTRGNAIGRNMAMPPVVPNVTQDPDRIPVAGARELVAQVAQLQIELKAALADQVQWRELVAALPQIVWITRPDGYHVYFNQQWMDFTGLTLAASLGDGWNPPFHPDERPLARRLWAEATRTGEPYEIEYRLRRRDGVYRWMLGRALPMRDDSGEIVKWFGTCTDIEELKAALDDAAALREELEHRATHDPLTGLGNRDMLIEQMELRQRQRRRAGLAVVFIDLDRFKAVNDRLGHRAGDQLLVHVADRLRAFVRNGDVVARIGGDEFVVVGEAADPEDAERLGQRLVEAVRGCILLEGEQVEVAASVGVSYVESRDAPSADEMLAWADGRMYEAKRRRAGTGLSFRA